MANIINRVISWALRKDPKINDSGAVSTKREPKQTIKRIPKRLYKKSILLKPKLRPKRRRKTFRSIKKV